MSTRNSGSAPPLKVPVGSLIAVAPPGAGKSTLLRARLAAAGLPADRVICRDDLRKQFGSSCPDLAHKMMPSTCQHHEDKVTERAEAGANSFLIEGRTWFYDQTGCNGRNLTVEVERAHAQGLAAVALRRRGNDGSPDVSFEFCAANNSSRTRRVPENVLRRMWNTYTELSVSALYALGFDVVLEWDENTTFELMPEGLDARNITTDLAVVGDIHGCSQTFYRLLEAIGTDAQLSNPNLIVVSVGDIHDKGQHSVEMIRWWLWALRTGRALMTDSNHNKALVRALSKPDATIRFGLASTIAEIEAQPDAAYLKAQIIASFSRLPNHLVFADHVVVHAAMTAEKLFRTDAKTRGFALHTRFEKTPWHWTGTQTLLHGHVVVESPTRRRALTADGNPAGEVVAIDTGAFAGGGLTAYLTASDTTVSVASVPSDQVDPAVQAILHAELVAAGIIPQEALVLELVS